MNRAWEIVRAAMACGVLVACAPVDALVGAGVPPLGGDAAGSCDGLAPLRLYYWNPRPADSANAIDYLVKVENQLGAAVPLESLELRYYFTNELAPPTALSVFYSDTCCSNKITFNDKVLTSLRPMSPRPGADSVLAIDFDPSVGTLAAGDAVQVELSFHDPQFGRSLLQTNDYSYFAGATGLQSDWDACPGALCAATFRSCRITVYRDGVLVGGVEP